jgi:hypothetical protein
MPHCVAAAFHRRNSRYDLGAGFDSRRPVGDQFKGGLRAWDHSAKAFGEWAVALRIAPEIPLPVRNDISSVWEAHRTGLGVHRAPQMIGMGVGQNNDVKRIHRLTSEPHLMAAAV